MGNYKFRSVMHTILVLCIFFLFAFYLMTGSCSLDDKKITDDFSFRSWSTAELQWTGFEVGVALTSS